MFLYEVLHRLLIGITQRCQSCKYFSRSSRSEPGSISIRIKHSYSRISTLSMLPLFLSRYQQLHSPQAQRYVHCPPPSQKQPEATSFKTSTPAKRLSNPKKCRRVYNQLEIPLLMCNGHHNPDLIFLQHGRPSVDPANQQSLLSLLIFHYPFSYNQIFTEILNSPRLLFFY